MNWATLLNAPVGELLWKKKQDLRLARNKQAGDRCHHLLLWHADVGASGPE